MNVYEYAMKVEKDGELDYRELADKTSDVGLKSILNMLADEEVKHYVVFDKMNKNQVIPTQPHVDVFDNAKTIFQKMREENPARVLSSGATVGKITIGAAGDYKNVDALVMELTNEMIDEVHQDNPDLVVLCNRKMVADKYFPLVNKDQENSEKIAADMIISQKRMGNLPVYAVPFFPEDAIFVTE